MCTLGRTILRLVEPTSGTALYNHTDLFNLSKKKFNLKRKELQMVFQDPYSSLNPKKRIGDILEEPLSIHHIGSKKERTNLALHILYKVGLDSAHYTVIRMNFQEGKSSGLV